MISLVEALNFRCLRYIRQPLGRFQVLVGPNASGKTTFLDVVGFLSDLVSDGLETAIGKRTQNPADLVWGRADTGFEIAIEATIPEEIRQLLAEEHRRFTTIRYEVGVGSDRDTRETILTAERVGLVVGLQGVSRQQSGFPDPEHPPNFTAQD